MPNIWIASLTPGRAPGLPMPVAAADNDVDAGAMKALDLIASKGE
jgi:hypothetical protein